MRNTDIDEILRQMELMIEIEGGLALFYERCSRLFPYNSDFWKGLSKEEIYHGKVLSKLGEAIRKNPDNFQVGKTFLERALRTFMTQISVNHGRLDREGITEADALFMAYHMESTMIESKYTEIIKSEKPQYIEALEKVAAATKVHKANLVERFKLNRKKK